ncbi:hypothetical protein K466DRAFT_598496 [Polyporus arcularius HHB13444]|uniref:Heterokaryon incompatibility domain-containing protein n=1 Tax=Polyporus arcularius HHB13444 TaxID=1314778 RepID=A0A5C3PIA6_9APHY|nr:hypothetical protein K466DRAFT_598496 [Polyporus arcularius HHB13444]
MDGSNRVHLSWRHIANIPDTLEVEVDKSDRYLRLYEDSLHYLETTYPVATLTCSLPDDIVRQPGIHPSLKTFVNLLADRANMFSDMPSRPDSHQHPVQELHITLTGDSDSVVDFVLSGLLEISLPSANHVTCPLRVSPDHIPASHLYQAFFLDCVARLWRRECYLRAGIADLSPMPWSRTSLRELSGNTFLSEPPYRTPTVGTASLADEDSEAMRFVQAWFGSPVDIPWLGAPHNGYPFCTTLSSYIKIRRDGAIRSMRDDAALWVSAMTFGLLEAVTRVRIPESLFIDHTLVAQGGEAILSGTRILRFLTSWRYRMRDHSDGQEDEEAHRRHGREAARILNRALNALDEEARPSTSMCQRGGYHESSNMVCAVALTVGPLCAVAHSVWKTLPEMDLLMKCATEKSRSFYAETLAACAERMYRAGWCPNTISLEFMPTLWDLSKVSNLLRLQPYIRRSRDEHKDCTPAACVLYTIADTKAYVPCHVDPACHCEYVKPPLDDITKLLSDGLIPALTYDGKGLRVRPAAHGAYVAVSHVWADGMGSTTEDGLPTCVVTRISKLVQKLLPDTGAFWMDSLCVPDARGLRKCAIKLMAQTYQDAAKVLVIDSCIRSQCSESKTWEENLFRIGTSGWARRVWTLQEGILAHELYFEFTEGPVNVEEKLGLNGYDNTAEGATHDRLNNDSLRFLPPHSSCSHVPLFGYRGNLSSPRTATTHSADHWNPDDVIRLLRLRTTSKPEDELVAISSFLPIDVDVLLSISGPDAAQRRLREYFLSQRELSKFFPMQCSARSALPQFTWAPCTLMSTVESAGLRYGVGICTTDGFTAEYFVGSLEKPIPIPETCRKGSREALEVYIVHHASMSAYLLTVYVNFVSAAPGTLPDIDALLLFEGDLREAETLGTVHYCAAVFEPSSGRGYGTPGTQNSEDAVGAVNQGLPRPVGYVAPARMERLSSHPDLLSTRSNVFVMGELCQNTVLLT